MIQQYKIYIKGNYLVIENLKTSEVFYGFKKEVFVDKNNLQQNIYRFFNVKDWNFKNSLYLSQIFKQDGTPYTQNEWEAFYTENTGNFNSGAVIAPQILDALNNANSPSGSNPFATLGDITLSVKSIDSLVVNSNGTLTINYTDGNNIPQTITTVKSVLDIKYNVLNYSALTSVSPSPSLYDFAYVRESQGIKWIGTYHGAGLYMFDGVNWIEDKTNIYQELDNILTNKADVNHNHVITDVTNLRTELDSLSSTTLFTLDGTVQINFDNTKFNFPGGSGVIIDNSIFPPIRTVVAWSALVAETTQFLNTSTNTFLAVDVNGNLVKTQDLQAVHDTSDFIIVGWIEHINGFIERVGTEPYYNLNIGQQFQQLLETIGAFNVEGNEVSANGVNLKLNISAGVVVDNGLGFNQNIKSPNHYVSNLINQVQFRYFYRDGLGDWVNNLPLVSDIDVHNYDDGSGTLQTILSGKWLLQRVFYYAPFGYLDIYHSQDYYNSAEEALDAYSRGGFEDNDYISYDIPVAIIVVRHNTTDLSNTADCIIRKVSSSKVGGSNVSSGESNTASNVGVNGVGLFKQKTGVDLEFKNINAGSNKITIIGDTVNNEVDIDVNEANFSNIPQSAVTNLTSDLANKVNSNTVITGATKTKITYDSKGLVTNGADATTADINDSLNRRYVTDAQLTVIGNTSGTNTGDNAVNSNYTNDYRASNFIAGVDYAVPNSNTTGTASNITATSNNTLVTLSSLVLPQSQVTGLVTTLAGKEPTITSGTISQYWRGDKSWQTLDKTTVGLSNVENTALSTWLGSTNITTLGTITTGTWSGTNIADNKIASALTGKTYNALSLSALATGFSISGGTSSKTLTINNSVGLSGTDNSTLNINGGGTLGSAAFTNSSAYEVPLTFSTGLTRTTNTVTVNTSQNISTLSNLTSNGYVKTGGGLGTLSVSSTIPNTDITGLGTLATLSSVNLTYTPSATNGTINSDVGTDAIIPLANGTNAGLTINDYTTTEKSKLSGIATGATANSSDSILLNRANHTGTQTASTISDFNSSVASTALLKANNLSDVSNSVTARNNILPSKTGNSLKVLRVNSGETDYELVTLVGGGDALIANPLSQFASTTSAQLAGVISDETGTGSLVFNTNPILNTPIIDVVSEPTAPSPGDIKLYGKLQLAEDVLTYKNFQGQEFYMQDAIFLGRKKGWFFNGTTVVNLFGQAATLTASGTLTATTVALTNEYTKKKWLRVFSYNSSNYCCGWIS